THARAAGKGFHSPGKRQVRTSFGLNKPRMLPQPLELRLRCGYLGAAAESCRSGGWLLGAPAGEGKRGDGKGSVGRLAEKRVERGQSQPHTGLGLKRQPARAG